MAQNHEIPLYKKVIPWVVAAAILSYLFWRIDFYNFLYALLHAKASLYIPVLVLFIIAGFLMDSQNIMSIANDFKHNLSFRDVLAIRGSSYLLMIINYTLGMGGMAIYLKKLKNIPYMRGTGLMFFYNYITQVALCFLAITGSALIYDSSPLIGSIMLFCILMLITGIVIVIMLKFLPDWRFVKKIKNVGFMKVFIEASPRSYIINVFYRCLHYSLFIGFFYWALRAFNISVPLIHLVAFVPIILLVISLPVSAFGLGTSQAAMLILFRDFGDEAQILAFSLVYSASVLILRGVIGIYYFEKITRLIPDKSKLVRGELS